MKNTTLAGSNTKVFIVFFTSLLWATPSQAHVKWFTEPTTDTTPLALDSGLITLSLVALLCAIIAAKGIDVLAKRYALTPQWLYSESPRPFRWVYSLIAIYFLGAALTNTFLAPHIQVSNTLSHIGVGVQLAIYSALLLNRFRGISALLLLFLFAVATWHDPVFALEYPLLLAVVWIVGFADATPSRFGVVFVRTLLGISLTTLAFTEKLLDPTRALMMLQDYNFNFMQLLGLPYSDELFVYSAGLVELLLGVLLIIGWVTRPAVLALFGFMVLTNAYFFMIGEYYLGWVELVGHLPIFACGLVLLFYHRAPEGNSASITSLLNARTP